MRHIGHAKEVSQGNYLVSIAKNIAFYELYGTLAAEMYF